MCVAHVASLHTSKLQLHARCGCGCCFQVGATPLVEYLTAQVPAEVAAASAEGWKRERTEAALAAAR
jgi:hypothetical protein